MPLFDAVRQASREWEGAFAVGFVSSREPDVVVGARKGSPLLVGLGHGENFLASDAGALVTKTRDVVYLEEGDVVEIRPTRITVCDATGSIVSRPVTRSELSADAVELGTYAHYMQKEIFEQPGAVAATLEMVTGAQSISPQLFGVDAERPRAESVDSACGTSYHAGMVARYWLEAIAGIPCSVEIASEYRYRESVPNPRALVVTISQSGETADTIAALKHAQSLGQLFGLAICNAPESTLVRANALRFLTRAGPEIGVASTKAFTTQLTALVLLTMVLARLRGRLSRDDERQLIGNLRHLPLALSRLLRAEGHLPLGPQVRRTSARAVPRPRHPLSDRDGRCTEAQGDFVHTRRGLPSG
jgi:glucosamine--fructose-6-phosphate aminotransferase (isomerizing)